MIPRFLGDYIKAEGCSRRLVIALTPTCPSIGAVPSQVLTELVKSGLGDKIFEYAKTHPDIIKEYRKGFPVILMRTK